MTRPRPPLGRAFGLILSGATLTTGAAYADRPLALSFQETPQYGRIVAKWGDGDETAPRIAASVASQVLILRFEEKVAVNLKALEEGLPTWAAVTRLDPDGRTLRIGLRQTPRLHVSTSVDLAAVDLVPEETAKDPPDILSPLVARRAAQAEARRIAALPPPAAIEELEVRGSHQGESTRLAFYWGKPVAYKVQEETPGQLKLLFARRAKPDLAYLRIDPPPNLGKFDGENTDKGYLVTITSKDGLPIKHFAEGGVTVIDISKPGAAPEETARTADTSSKPAAKAGATPAGQAAPAAKPPPAPAPVSLLPRGSGAALFPPAETAQAPAPEPVGEGVLGGGERVSQLRADWVEPAPRSGVVDVKFTPTPNGLDIQAAFATPAAAAVFSRAGAVWAVFASGADLKVDPAAIPTGFRVRAMRAEKATVLRIEAPKGMTVSAEAEGASWTIRLAGTALRPKSFLKLNRTRGKDGRSRIEADVPGAEGVIWLEDPAVGDEFAAIVAKGPSAASPTPRDFVEAMLPATAHGLAVAPKSDNVEVLLDGTRAIISVRSDAAVTLEPAIGESELALTAANPAFMDFAGWGGLSGERWYKRRKQLEGVVNERDPATPEGAAALMDLARFHVGHGFAAEALGVLRILSTERPAVEQDPQYLGLVGVANALAYRWPEAEDLLSKGPLRGDPSAALWRGLVAAERGEWERAIDFFRIGEDQIDLYPPEWSARFSALLAEAALNTNDFDTARRRAELAANDGERADKERGELVMAQLKAIIEEPSAAYDDLAKLSSGALEPVAVRAELKRLEIGAQTGQVSPAESAAELESLRFRWRGDGVEMATVGILADQYMRAGRFREALRLAQSAAMRDVTAPGSRELRMRISEYFRKLYLDGDADKLDPIQALALFYEFADLTPIGTDGDQMIRKLAQRLAAFDLLEPAAQLLQHQVDNRMRGIGKSALAVDLATIYLLDKRPDKALVALNTTRQPSLPKELALERRLLEAAAYRDLGRYDHVVELVSPLESLEAKSLLADAYMRDRKFPEAARAYLGMLPPAKAATAADAPMAFKAAIAARMAKDAVLLGEARAYSAIFAADANKPSFDLITAQADVSGAALTEAVRRLADAPGVDAFSKAMKARLEAPKTSVADAPAAPPPAPTPAPAQQAASAAPTAPAGGSR
jgi:hypothetical protein